MANFLSEISKQIKGIPGNYSKCSSWGKVMIFTILLLILIVAFKPFNTDKYEGFEQNDKFLFSI